MVFLHVSRSPLSLSPLPHMREQPLHHGVNLEDRHCQRHLPLPQPPNGCICPPSPSGHPWLDQRGSETQALTYSTSATLGQEKNSIIIMSAWKVRVRCLRRQCMSYILIKIGHG